MYISGNCEEVAGVQRCVYRVKAEWHKRWLVKGWEEDIQCTMN